MKAKQITSIAAVALMAASMGAPAVSAEESTTDYGGITLTLMNSKPEIQSELEKVTSEWGAEHNVTFDVYKTDAPQDTLAQKYASGDAPVISICDPGNVTEMGEEKFLDLSNEKWVADGGDTLGTKVNGVLYGFPVCVEADGMVYNKSAIEDILGREFIADDYATPEKFEELLKELRDGGMENPIILNQEIWSLGGHLLGNIYVFQDGTADGSYKFVKDTQEGVPVKDNAVFQNLITDLDMFIEYNINKKDPLAADYDMNAAYLAEGDAAFWVNGSWVWPDMQEYVDDSTDFGIMPIPKTDESMQNKINAFASKDIAIDKEMATEEQQKAALEFLDWLVYSEEGQDAMVNRFGFVVAFTNNPNAPVNPINENLKTYIDSGNTVNNAPYSGPTDGNAVMGPHMQAYVVGQENADDLAKDIEDYWSTRNPK